MSYKTANELGELYTKLEDRREEFDALIEALEGSDNDDLTEDQNAEYAENETLLDAIRPAIRVIEQSSEEAYDAACECFGEKHAVEALESGAYLGEYHEPSDYAREMFNNMYSVSEELQPYIDYDRFLQELEDGGDIISHNGHYFHGSW